MAFKYVIADTAELTEVVRNSTLLPASSSKWRSSSSQTIVPYAGTKPAALSAYTEKSLATVKADIRNSSDWGTDKIWSSITYGSITSVAFALSGGSNALGSYIYIADSDDYDSRRTYKIYNAKIVNETTGGENSLGTITLFPSVAIGTLRLLTYTTQNVTSNCGCGAAHNNNGSTNDYHLEGILGDGYNNEQYFISPTVSLTNVTK